MQKMIDASTASCRSVSIEKFVNGRSDIEKKAGSFGELNVGQLAAEAPDLVDSHVERLRHSKTVLKRLRSDFQDRYSRNLRVLEPSKYLLIDELSALGKKL